MRVVYLWDADYPWDVRTEKICAALTAAGHEVHIVARNRAWAPLRERLPEGTVHRMPPWRLLGKRVDGLLGFPAFFSPRWLALLARVVREARPQVIVARDLPLCPTALWVGRAFRVPVVFDMAENYPAMMQNVWSTGRQKRWDFLVRNPRLVRMVERYCLPRVDRTLAVVRESAERVERLGVPGERVAVVSNTPPAAHAGHPRGTAGGDPGAPVRIVYLGLMEAPRGVGDLLRAAALLRDRGVEVCLKLIGTGRELPLFRSMAEELGLAAPRVEFLGYVDRREALRIVGEADVGTIPHFASEAWNTTIPNKLFDYMAAGLAVVTSDAAPAARIVRETGAGVVFRSRDPESLAGAIEAMRDPGARAAFGAAGRAAVLGEYNWENDTAVLLRVVEEVAGEARRSRREDPAAAAAGTVAA